MEERAGVSQGTAEVGRVRRVCWEMPCKVYIPCCLFTWKKFPAEYIQGAGSLETKTTGCQNPTHHWVRVASAHLRSKRGYTHAGVSPERLLSVSGSFAKNNLEWVSEESIQCYWGQPDEGRGAGEEGNCIHKQGDSEALN